MTSGSPDILPVLGHIPGIRAFFTTRRGGVSEGAFASLNLGYFTGDEPGRVRKNWELLLNSQGLEGRDLVLPRLVHGSALREISGGGDLCPEGVDAVYTRNVRPLLAVTLADCLGALIADAETRCVAAVHAGWRGSRDGILPGVLRRLFALGHCRPESTWVALGPCLSTRALEVSAETAGVLPAPHVRREEDRFFFDMRGCNRAQAESAGVAPERITGVEACTRAEPERFFSHRRDGAASGRMAACIALV